MKDYRKILEGVVNIISTTEESKIISNICSYIVENCPELGIKAQDEVIRKWLVGYFNQYATDGIEKFGNDLEVKDVIAWLEKQGEQKSQRMISAEAKEAIFGFKDEIQQEDSTPKTESNFLFKVKYEDKEYNVRRIFGAATFELYNESESNVYVDLPDCEIIRGGYGIKENGFSYPTKPATFSEQESVKVNKIEPKFQPGDWVVCEDDCSVHQIKGCFENLNNHTYDYELTEGGHISGDDVNKYHTWTLDDAKDGDILVSTVTNKPFIYNGSSDDTHVSAYCGINVLNAYKTAYPPYFWTEKKSIAPATEEQRNFLFERMKEANYMWDFSNKKLVKIKTN